MSLPKEDGGQRTEDRNGWIYAAVVIGVAVLCLLSSVFVPAAAQAATYYIDYSAGSDSNMGTSKSTPWKRQPFMTGFAGTYTHQAGDQFIFKGGVSWPAATFPLTISAGGPPNDYYGVDKTWFSGSTWASPIFDGGFTAPPGGSLVVVAANNVQLDNLEIRNIQVNNSGGGGFENALVTLSWNVQNTVISNASIHSWTTTVASCSTGCDFQGGGVVTICGSNGCNNLVDHSVIYNDTSNKNLGSCTFNIDTVQYSTLHDCTEGTFGGTVVHDNIIYNILTSGDASAHENALQTSGGNVQIYNNIVHDQFHGTAIYPVLGPDSGTVYIYNNVVWNTVSIPITPDPERIGSATVDVVAYNNTADPGGGPAFRVAIRPVNNPVRSYTIKNNHWITDSATPVYIDPGTPSSVIITQSNNVLMTQAVAAAQGYTVSDNFAPTAPNNTTIGAGFNLRSLGITPLNSDMKGIARPISGAWDAGAYEFGGGPPPSPCDVNQDGVVNVADVQLEVNMALGISPCTNPSGTCTVVSVQRVVNAALGGTCVAP